MSTLLFAKPRERPRTAGPPPACALYAEEHDLKLNAVVQQALKEYLTHAE